MAYRHIISVASLLLGRYHPSSVQFLLHCFCRSSHPYGCIDCTNRHLVSVNRRIEIVNHHMVSVYRHIVLCHMFIVAWRDQ